MTTQRVGLHGSGAVSASEPSQDNLPSDATVGAASGDLNAMALAGIKLKVDFAARPSYLLTLSVEDGH
jgi:hypothetical protein